MMTKEQLFESGMLEMYVLGLTSPEETRQVEELARKHPEVQEEINSMHRALEQYASQHAIPPPSDLKRKVLKRVDGMEEATGQEDRRSRAGSGTRLNYALLAAGVLFFLSTLFFFNENSKNKARLSTLSAKQALLVQECDEKKRALEEKALIFAFLSEPSTLPVQLTGSAISPEATALVYWNESKKKVYLSMQGMPEPPKGKQFQLWADVEGEMINMGLVDPGTGRMQEMTHIAHAESVNLTLEPLGGSEHPTVSLLYANSPLKLPTRG